MAMTKGHNLRDLWVLVNHLPMQNIKILDIIILMLILHNSHHHITLMIYHLPNHLSYWSTPTSNLLSLWNRFFYLSQEWLRWYFCVSSQFNVKMTTLCKYLWMYFVEFTILYIYFNILIPQRMYLCILFMLVC